MEILPAEIYPIILSHADFGLWRAARYVSRKWNSIIAANQCVQIWNFIRGGRLPNGTRHGYVNQHPFCDITYYKIFRYGNKIAREISMNYQLSYRELFDTSGLISFGENYKDDYIIYCLCFKVKHHEEFFCINFDKYLNTECAVRMITIRSREYIRTHNNPFLFVHDAYIY